MVLLSKKQKKSKTLKYKNLLLLGMMASGKTSLASEISKLTGLQFVDLDCEIIRNTNQDSINAIFEKFGEKYFRELEAETLQKILKKQNQVISLGGGALLDIANQDLILTNKDFLTVWLDTDIEVIYKRLLKLKDRPVFNNIDIKSDFIAIYKARSQEYRKAQIRIVNNSDNELTPSALALKTISLIEDYAKT